MKIRTVELSRKQSSVDFLLLRTNEFLAAKCFSTWTKSCSRALNSYGYFRTISLFPVLENNLFLILSWCVNVRFMNAVHLEVNKLDLGSAPHFTHAPAWPESGEKILTDQHLIKGCQFSHGSFRFESLNYVLSYTSLDMCINKAEPGKHFL